jgi:alpha-ribazole phosphatase
VIWLLRHGPVRVAPGICYGRLDVAPEPCAPLALDAPQDAAVFVSPAARCVALAQALGRAFTTDARLLELDFGAWEGQLWDDVPRAALDAWAADPWGYAPPGGENGMALLARVQAFWDAAPRPVVVVSHGGPLRLLRALAEGRAPDILEAPPPLGAVLRIG